MGLRTLGQAVAMFAVTNIDDLVVLALFFGQAAGHRAGVFRVVLGQYLGFAAILAASVLGSVGAGLLPEVFIPYLGLLPLALGLRAAWRAWRERLLDGADSPTSRPSERMTAPAALAVAGVTFANGGDNIGVYVPVFTTTNAAGLVTYCAAFLVMVGIWCALGLFFATRPMVARALSRSGHVLLPVVLIGIGLLILVQGGAFGL
ncbi:cadmium resistance protein CadD (predicted permease) [Oryzihumus leptocrescens]|uniref:Cadmium resistance protein CadD (Predicted permease) n=2 Tax=Oryzihumus leptocrescens TaxID=297536 RepID=A0A542ZH69_9MICO|nr:cadmium resistance transporter [Oryzihumus leptocrescens]TQL59674.1 cadmium resistance protein CadD (predicted permease) [Oryzihumus leptocrescens]